MRLGEAANPGPNELVLGNMNPTGLMGKARDLSALPKGLYAVQETHLTAQGIPKFKQELTWAKSGYHLTHGMPAPPKNASIRTIGGKHTGVAYLSPYPCRSLVHTWTPEQFATGRCLAATAFVNQRWLTMGTVYGYNEKSHTVEVQQHTGDLLHGLTTRIVDGARGLRCISGDWNLDRNNIPQASYWEAQGWMEAQTFACRRWSTPIGATCKHTTVKDFMFLSPEVLPYVTAVELDWSCFADHAVLLVYLSDLAAPPLVPMWRKPSQFEWPNQQQCKQVDWPFHAAQSQDMDAWYANIWKNVERYADKLLTTNNKPPLQPHQCGRATTTEVKWSIQQTTPVKPNRRGDIQSQLAASTMQHCRWTKQVRRLEHFARCPNCPDSLTHAEHRACLWGKILRAPGFHGGFCHWWINAHKAFVDTPSVLPRCPPEPTLAHAIFLEFSRHYRSLESSLMQARSMHATQRRVEDPLLIYRDLQRERAEPVQTIVQTQEIPVVSSQDVHQTEKVELHLAAPLPDSVTCVQAQGVPVAVTTINPHSVVVGSSVAAAIGPTVSFQSVVGNPREVLSAFEQEWQKRWQRHEETKAEKWQPIIDFAKHALPKRQTTFPAITSQLWQKTVAKKRKNAAVGPDGVSRRDMLEMPSAAVDDMVALIHAIEEGAPWPQQLVTGHVAALAKSADAQTVSQYRPICVFPLPFRCWGTIRAKQCLRYLATFAPCTLMGNMPKRSPRHIGFHVQQLIEHSYCHDTEVAGGVIDIVKCFNMLPQQPLLEIASHLGIPSEVMQPWHAALRQLQRRFQVQGCVGRSLTSSCGFAEGDAMSVVAMAVCNVVCDMWMYFRYPSVRVWSFVDNIETVAQSAQDAINSVRALEEFCSLLDLETDPAKTFCWSTSSSGRKLILEHDQNRKYFARDLGGHMNYSKLRTNASVQDKIKALTPFWSRMARSAAPITQKQRALYVSAWPNIFYGICTVTLGSCHFQKLRTLAVKAMNLTQNGVNPDLQLSCVCPPLADPEFYSLLSTVMAFREHHSPDLSQFTLHHLANGRTFSQGPCNSFLHAIHKIAWSWTHADECSDQNGHPVFICRSSKTELRQRLMQAWQDRILHQTQELRHTMQGLADADVRRTLQAYHALPQEHQGLMRCCLNGTQFTNDVLHKAGITDTDCCKFCGQTDSQLHRHWECPFFADLRPENVIHCKEQMPLSFLCHGWLPRTSAAVDLVSHLFHLPDTTTEFFHAPNPVQLRFLDLFLDGSCIMPAVSECRLASWGFVQWTGEEFWPVANGTVPGWRQTSLRGELTAAISALKFVTFKEQPSRLWFDNSNVQDTLHHWLQGVDTDWRDKTDQDLWQHLHDQFQHARPFLTAVYKVQAHAAPACQDTALDEWTVLGNIAADWCARSARLHFPRCLWDAWEATVNHVAHSNQLGLKVHQMFVQIALRARNCTLADEPLPPKEFPWTHPQPLLMRDFWRWPSARSPTCQPSCRLQKLHMFCSGSVTF